MIGEIGNAITAISSDGGRVFVFGEYWKATSETEIAEGSQIEVVEATNLLLKVKQKSDENDLS